MKEDENGNVAQHYCVLYIIVWELIGRRWLKSKVKLGSKNEFECPITKLKMTVSCRHTDL